MTANCKYNIVVYCIKESSEGTQIHARVSNYVTRHYNTTYTSCTNRAVILSDLVMNGFMEILDPISDGACLIE